MARGGLLIHDLGPAEPCVVALLHSVGSVSVVTRQQQAHFQPCVQYTLLYLRAHFQPCIQYTLLYLRRCSASVVAAW